MKKILPKLLLCSMLISLFMFNKINAQVGKTNSFTTPNVGSGVPPPPGPITGPTSVGAPSTSQYTVPPIIPGITLNWHLTPAAAGSISFTINQATVTWNGTFTGIAQVSCTATNSYGTSAPSNLAVQVTGQPPALTCSVAPASQTIIYNKVPATLRGTVSGGSTYTYQWQSSTNNVNWTTISGATSVNYTPGALMATAYYQLLVTSSGVSVASNTATVIVNPATNPANVDTTFSNAMAHVFGTLNTSNIPTGLLRDAGFELTNLENYNGAALVDSNIVDAEVLRTIYATLASARMTNASASTLPGASSVDSSWFSRRQPGQVTLCGLYYQYSYLNTSVNPNPNITITNGQLFDKYVNGVWQNPYLQGQTVAFAPAGATYPALNFNLVLPTSLWFTNSAGTVSLIQVDAGDGLGYRTLTPGTPLAVTYAAAGLKPLNFKLTLTNGTVLQSHSQITVTGTVDNSTCWGPQCSVYVPPGGGGGGSAQASFKKTALTAGVTQVTPPDLIAGSSSTYYFQTGAKYNGAPAQGKVTVHLANGQTLVNPLIIVEGFDDAYYTTPESWAGTLSLDYYRKYQIGLNSDLDNVMQSYYDVVFVDFKNGTDDIHRNALLVESVIRWVNQYKTGTNKNVVLGLSMGGLCARYALKTMENNGETHQVGLFICHGSPQQGAVIPLGLQAGNVHINSLYARAILGATDYNGIANLYNNIESLYYKDNRMPNIGGMLSLNNSPAALQMEINHLNSNYQIDNTVHNAWQSELSALGYPSQGGIQNMAISNGSECGQAQALTPGGTILSLNANASTSIIGDILAEVGGPYAAVATGQPSFLLSIIPGRNSINTAFQVNAEVDGGGNLGYSGKITYTKKVLWLVNVTTTITNRTFTNPSGVFPYETFAGDNMPITNLTYTATPGWLGKYNIQMAYVPAFGFVPTPSVLDIGQGKTTLLESDYSLPYSAASPPAAPKNTPFTNFITAFSPLSSQSPNNNESHLDYETRNSNWLTNVLNDFQSKTMAPVADCTALCQANASGISGPAYICSTDIGTYTVPAYSNVSYVWTVPNNLAIVSGQNTASLQVRPTGAPGIDNISVAITINNQPDCFGETLSLAVSVGLQPLTVNSTVDRTVEASHYQYLTATATQLPNTTPSNYTWWLMVNNQPTTQIGSGLQLRNYPIAPCTTIYYQCQAVTSCGLSTYSGYAYNTYCSGSNKPANQSVVIYPNPADQTMSVTNNSVLPATDASGNPIPGAPKSYRLVVLDSSGNTLISKPNQDGNPTISFSTAKIANGHYFIHIIQGANVVEKQIVIQHQ